MKYIKLDVNNYHIHMIKTNKFKTISIKFCFKRFLKKEDVIIRNLLSDILIMSNNKYKNKQELEKRCEELFGINLSINNKRLGNYYILNLDASFLNENYTEDGMNKECIDFIKNILLNPKVVDNKFDENTFDMVKRSFKEDVMSIKENATNLGIINMRKHMDPDSLLSVHPFFYIDELDKITSEDLYKYYLDVLENDELDIYILGDFNDELINQLSDLKIGSNLRSDKSYIIEHDKFRNFENIVKENSNFSQSKLSIIFKLKNLTDFERKYVLYVYSFILGGTAGSILFKKLRLDNSLCYYINSNYNYLYNILEVMAGINSKSFDKSLELIKSCISDIENKNFDLNEIENAKTAYLNACDDITDNPFGIISGYVAHNYYNSDLIEEKKKNIMKVKVDDLVSLSNKIIIDTVYLLKGENENEEN